MAKYLEAIDKGHISDTPASFHRTNPYPLDYSSVLCATSEEDLNNVTVTARTAKTGYTGQIITIEHTGKVRTFVLQNKGYQSKQGFSIENTEDEDETSSDGMTKTFAQVSSSDVLSNAEELAYKSWVEEQHFTEVSNRLTADAAERYRASNAEAAVVGGLAFSRDAHRETFVWHETAVEDGQSSGRTLTYNSVALKADVKITPATNYDQTNPFPLGISTDGLKLYTVDNRSTPIFLVAAQENAEQTRTTFLEFGIAPNTQIDVYNISSFIGSFGDTYYIFDSLNYTKYEQTEDSKRKILKLNEDVAIGTLKVTLTSGNTENTGGWQLTYMEQGADSPTVRPVPSIINIMDSLDDAAANLVTVNATNEMSQDGTLTINLSTLTKYFKKNSI